MKSGTLTGRVYSFRSGRQASGRSAVYRRAVPRAAKRAARLMVEGLELRKLLATVNGTAGNDTIGIDIVGANIVVTVNGTPNNFADAANTTIVVNAGDGNDTVTLNTNGNNATTINGGIGDDSVIVGNGDYDNNITSTVQVNGDAGTADLLTINDTTDGAGSDVYTLTSGSFAKAIGPILSFNGAVEQFVLDGSPNADTINVNNTSTATAVTVNGGDGADTVIVGNGDYDFNILNSLVVHGGLGVDSVQVSDGADAGNDSYTLNNTFTKSSIASVLDATAENFTITASTGAAINTFNLLAYPSGAVVLGGGGGNDTFNVGGGDLDTRFASVSLQGDAGADALVVDDTADGIGADTWDLNALQLSKGGGAGVINYDALLENIVINGSAQSDLWNVNATTATIPIIINAGDGNDTLDAAGPNASHNNDIDNAIVNSLSFNGGVGIDRVDLTDTGDSADDESYFISNTSFSKSSGTFGALLFDGTNEVFNLVANDGANAISFGNFPDDRAVTANGGAGNDTITNSNFNAELSDTSTLVVSGGSGTDTWIIDETGDADATEYLMTPAAFRVTAGNLSGTASYVNFDQITFTGSAQPTAFYLTGYGTTPLTLDMGGGNDTVVAGGGDVDSNLASNLTLAGGLGVDSLVVNDSNDGASADILTISAGVTNKNSRLLTYNGFEAQQYLGNANATVITIDSMNVPTTITGGSGSEQIIVTPTSQDIDNVGSILTIDGNGGIDTAVLNDTLDTGDDIYALTATTFTKPGAGAFPGLNFSGLETLDIEANGLNNTFNIDGSAIGTTVTIAGGLGNDTFNVGGADSIASGFGDDITLGGGGGADALNFNDQAFTTGSTYLLTNIRVQRSGQGSTFFNGTTETITFNAGTGNDTINILQLAADTHFVNAGSGNDTINLGDNSFSGSQAVLATTSIDGGTGADSFFVGKGDLDEIVGPVTVSGGGGADQIVVDDSLDAGSLATSYTIADTTLARVGAGTAFGGLTFFDEASIRFSLNQSGTPITLNDAAGGSGISGGIIEANGGIDTITVVNAPTSVTVRGGAGLDSINVNSDLVDVANIAFDQNEDFQDISTRTGGLLTFVGNIVVRTQTSSIAASPNAGVINFNGGTLIAPAVNLLSYVDALERGYNGGAWNGASNGSFRSGTAAGSALGDALGYAVIGAGAGQLNATTVAGTVPVVAGDLVVTYTLGGDADLDRDVDFSDLVSLAQNYDSAVGGKNWRQGNFNYNTPDTAVGAVGFSDLVILAQNYNLTVLTSARGVSVKEGRPAKTDDLASGPASRRGEDVLDWSRDVLASELV